ncbi:HYR-like domain-containing protein, partial [Flavobacterium caseinilyticum]
MKKNILRKFFEVLSSKINCWIPPKNIISTLAFYKNENVDGLKSKTSGGNTQERTVNCNVQQVGMRTNNIKNTLRVFNPLLIAFLLFALLPLSAVGQTCDGNTPSQPDLRLLKLGCSANDVEIISATLGKATCVTCTGTEVQELDLFVTLRHNTNSDRPSVSIFGNLTTTFADKTTSICDLLKCSGPLIPKNQILDNVPVQSGGNGIQIIKFGTIKYTCGSSLVLSDIMVAWTVPSDDPCPMLTSIPSKCSYPGGTLVIVPPLQATAEAFCSPDKVDVTVLGGIGPYTYSWTGPAGFTSTQKDPPTLGPGDYTVTVTDSDLRKCTTTATARQIVCCTPSATCKLGPIDIEGCSIPVAFTDPNDVFSGIQSCGKVITMTSADVGDTDVCGDGDGADFSRTYSLFFGGDLFTTCAQSIKIDDTTAPVIAALPAPSTINCPALPAFAQATATDTCDASVTLTFNDVKTPGNCAGNYSVTRTWTATDDCGNFSTATQTINVQDITAPVIAALPALSTINCPALPAFAQATATDTCDASVTLTFNDVKTPGNCAGNYSVTRTWTATDDCGNFSTATQTINVQDITAPVIAALPAPSTINCPALPAFAQATATDTCDASVTLTFNDVKTPGNCAGNYSVTRTWTATDDCGNFSTATQTINVQDITAPVIAALPAPSTINCPALP